MRTFRAVVLLALATVGACTIERSPRVDPVDPVSIARTEIELTLRDFQEALVAGDARRAAAYFTPGAHLYLPDSPDIAGRGDIDRAMSGMFAGAVIVDMTMQFDGIDVASGVAHQFGRFHQRLRREDGEERAIEGRFAIRWLRGAESTWRMERMLLNRAARDSVDLAEPSSTPPT